MGEHEHEGRRVLRQNFSLSVLIGDSVEEVLLLVQDVAQGATRGGGRRGPVPTQGPVATPLQRCRPSHPILKASPFWVTSAFYCNLFCITDMAGKPHSCTLSANDLA